MSDIHRLAQTFGEMRQDSSDRQALAYLRKAINMPREFRRALERTEQSYGDLVLGAWLEAFPTFPFLVVVRSSEKLKALSGWNHLFGTKKGEKFVSEFVTIITESQQAACGRPVLVMTKLANVPDWIAVHNAVVADSANTPTIRVPCDDSVVLTIERVDAVIDRWRDIFAGYFEDAVDLTS